MPTETAKRGHWTLGKRRHEEPSWLAAAAQILKRERTGGGPIANPASIRSLAAALDVSDRTVRRWLDGTDYPGPQHTRTARRWIARHTR